MNNIEAYTLGEEKESGKLKFFFESIGTEGKVPKLIEYSYIQPYGLGGLYNLGFGDFESTTGTFLDDSNTNNGDMWPVLNTVLSTIPLFFKEYPYDTLAVRGSDSAPGFEAKCRLTCPNPKRCKTVCRNLNRRINSYRYFLDKHHPELIKTYSFYGYIQALGTVVPYKKDAKYDAIFVARKKLPIFVSS